MPQGKKYIKNKYYQMRIAIEIALVFAYNSIYRE